MKRIVFLFAILLGSVFTYAEPFSEDIEVSVLTCSPGQEVYSLYGHTAIRVKDMNRDIDYVFNYGVFDFDTEYFVWKFVLGETDYICMATPWEYFIQEYKARGSQVVAQVLNLTESEAVAVRDYLMNNIKKENRTYRYNFLTNNCTTRVMDCIDACVEGELIYSWATEPLTYRQILHQYTKDYPWEEQGNDFLLGADVDTLLSNRAKCFIPDYYMNALDKAVVRNGFQDTRKLVKTSEVLSQAENRHSKAGKSFPATPLVIGGLASALMLLVLMLEVFCKKVFWPLDMVLMLVHGLAGCLIAFMFFFSQHPAVGSNWLVGVLNPIPLIALPYTIKAAWKKERSAWHYLMATWMAFYLLFIPWMPQEICITAIFFVAIQLSRQISYILYYRHLPKNKIANKSQRKKAGKKKK